MALWNETEDLWNLTDLLWSEDEIALVSDVISSGGITKQIQSIEELPQKKKEKIIKIILTLNGIKYDEQQVIKNYKVSVKDVMLLKTEYENQIKILVENIKIG